MGGKPLCAMNIVCFPSETMEISILRAILAGGLAKLREAAVALAGGHSVEDRELKYGLSVTGVVHPDRVLTNRGVRAGDRLVLSKPLGTGIIATAVKAGLASDEAQAASVRAMRTLNRGAAERMADCPVHACTDVTGFGLAGHLCEMIEEQPIEIRLAADALPVLPGAREYAEMGLLPAGLHRNREYRKGMVAIDDRVPLRDQDILFDPQTSGGLLIALPAEDAASLVKQLRESGLEQAAIIGEAVAAQEPLLRLTG
jgi:selenide,water dikinase